MVMIQLVQQELEPGERLDYPPNPTLGQSDDKVVDNNYEMVNVKRMPIRRQWRPCLQVLVMCLISIAIFGIHYINNKTSIQAVAPPGSVFNKSYELGSPKTTTTNKSTPPRRLRIVSMNVAELLPSKNAPPGYSSEEELLKELLKSDPDVLCVQECPYETWAGGTFGPSYQMVGSRPTHAGYVSLLVRSSLKVEAIPAPSSTMLSNVPAVVGLIADHVMVASVHLHPSESGDYLRKWDMEGLKSMTTEGDTPIPILVASDTNMRDSEDDTCEQELGFTDVWKESSPEDEAMRLDTKFTWDTMDHGIQGFNAFYGDKTRQYQRRYDRVYVLGCHVDVHSFQLIGNHPLENRKHFFSDHFGIAVDLTID